MDSYPHIPGTKGTDTSIAAAEFMKDIAAPIQRAVMRVTIAAGSRGLTAHELSVSLGMERTTVQPRTSELRRLGKIKDSGQRRANPNGKKAIVWVATGGAK